MTALNCEASDVNVSIGHLVRQKEEIEAEVDSLCSMMYLMKKARLKYESSVDYMSRKDEDVFPLSTDSIYGQGDLGNFKYRRGFSRNYPIDWKESALYMLFAKIEKINLKLSVAQRLLSTKILEREKLRRSIAEKLLLEKKREYEFRYPLEKYRR